MFTSSAVRAVLVHKKRETYRAYTTQFSVGMSHQRGSLRVAPLSMETEMFRIVSAGLTLLIATLLIESTTNTPSYAAFDTTPKIEDEASQIVNLKVGVKFDKTTPVEVVVIGANSYWLW